MKSSATNSVIIVTFVFSLHLTIGSKGVYPFTGLDYPDMASSHNHKRWPRQGVKWSVCHGVHLKNFLSISGSSHF